MTPSGVVAVGNALLIDNEPMLATAVTTATGGALTVTVTRGNTVSPLATPQAHASGAAVSVLVYKDAYHMIAFEDVLPAVRKISTDLGERSAVFGYTVTGQATVTS